MSALGDIFSIPDLRRKLLITVLLLGMCRVGVYVTMPGVNVAELAKQVKETKKGGAAGQLLGLMDLFAGGAFGRCAVFGLGVMPYISASIIFQLLTSVVPSLERLQREGEVGRKRIHQYTRYATVVLCLVQGAIAMTGMRSQPSWKPYFDQSRSFIVMAAVLLTTGTMLLMWIGEQIDEYGIGNGISLIIMINILDRLPTAVLHLAQNATFHVNPEAHQVGPAKIVLLLGMFVAIVVGVVFITEGQRRIPFQQASHTRGRRVYVGQKHYLPLRVNQAGVIPIIFAQSLLMFPATIASGILGYYQGLPDGPSRFGYGFWTFIADQLRGGTFLYIVFYMALIFIFCFFWTAVQFNPQEMANNMKEHGTFILGIRPGRRTAEYLERVMTRITLPGAAFLAIIAIMPSLMTRGMGLGWDITGFYGGTSLLIVVGVALDLVKKIESHLVMRHYDGFMKGRSRGGRRRGGRTL